jgi:hypothetical protein
VEKPPVQPLPEPNGEPFSGAGRTEGFLPVNPSAEPSDYFPPSERAATIVSGSPQRISGVVGRTITVTLPGIGWTYLQDEDAEGKIRYLGKLVEGGITVFSFAPFARGDYNLKFQQQDLAANTMRYDDVNLAVSPAEDAAQNAARPSAETMPPQERSEAAPPAIQPETPAQAPPAAPSAALEPSVSGDETELQRLQKLIQEGRPEALAEFENYISSREGEIEDLDALYFQLAQTFEKDSPLRDMKKSLMYYEKVRDLFPLSPHWADSDIKSRFIRLNYFEIR